jgi:hypothetical protein
LENLKFGQKKGCVFNTISDVPGPESSPNVSRGEAKVKDYERDISIICLLAMMDAAKYKIELPKLKDQNNIGHFACVNTDTTALQLMHDKSTKSVHPEPGSLIMRATYYLAIPTDHSHQSAFLEEMMEQRFADIPVQMDLARDIKVKPVSITRSIHKTCPMISACMNTDTTNISHQSVCQKQPEKKAELAAIPRSPEDGQYHDDPSLGEAGLKFEEGGEDVDDEQAKGDDEELSHSNIKCTIGELRILSKMENEARSLPLKIENLESKLENKNLKKAVVTTTPLYSCSGNPTTFLCDGEKSEGFAGVENMFDD